ncbi:MAG: metallophosphoesterase family protein [Kiritimatiellae bacterium]|nr:metallophosphoesterase family protein [Kiritimatiellia bacterium]MDD5521469.1 metallophosphoesterase family protein [Kiritimatiellia bacterium]
MGDIHGNFEALETVIKDAKERGANSFVCVGDVVGYNANPAECLEMIKELKCVTVRGNHDHYCSHDECLDDFHPLAANVVDWTRHQLAPDQITYLKQLKMACVVDGFTIVHSTLDMPEKWGYVFDTLEANANFTYQTTSVCFHGHTHVPIVYEKQSVVNKIPLTKLKIMLGKKYFINVGSVGQPRDGDPRSAYVIYDPKTKEVELRRLAYDISKTQEKIRKVHLPERLAKRLEAGR